MQVIRPSVLVNTDLPAPLLPRLVQTGVSYWAWGGAFVAVYVLLERASLLYQLDGLGITLWSPSAGASLIFLLMMGVRFAPFVFVASLMTDFVIYAGPRGFAAPIGTSAVLAIGITSITLLLAKMWCGRRVGSRASSAC